MYQSYVSMLSFLELSSAYHLLSEYMTIQPLNCRQRSRINVIGMYFATFELSLYILTLSKLYRGFISVERSVMSGSTEVLMGISGCRELYKLAPQAV